MFADGKSTRTQLEVDFVCNQTSRRYYIQSALSLPTKEKLQQEEASLLHINDSFQKVIIAKDAIISHYNDDGILILPLFEFLLHENALQHVRV
ncbi:MAG TPA: ATPase [Selenomonas sp.]|nr:ATPase [Selenomonas sp.]